MIVEEYSESFQISLYDIKKMLRTFVIAGISLALATFMDILPLLQDIATGYAADNLAPTYAVLATSAITSLVDGVRRFLKDYSSGL